jgi:sugar (pentulose or hexulose) kinase
MIEGVLVVDVGTTKVHTNLIGVSDGRLLENRAYSYEWIHPAEGWSEVDALIIWEAAQKAVGEIVTKCKNKYEIKAIAFSYIGDSLLAVDKNDTPLGNMILAMDERAKIEAQEITDQYGEKLFDEIGTSSLRPSVIPAKLLWIKKNQPEVFKNAAYFLNIQQFLNLKLGLGTITDYTLAGRKVMFNFKQMKWSESLCDFLGIPVEKLGGDIRVADSVYGSIRRFGRVEFDHEIPVVLGAHDSESGMIGLGCIPGQKTILGNIAGTYDHIGYLLKYYPDKLEGFFGANCGPLKNSYVLMGATISGPSLEWFVKTFFPNEGLKVINRLFDLYKFDGMNKVFLTRGIQTGDGCIRGINMKTGIESLFKAIVEGLTFPLQSVMINLTKFNGQKFDSLRMGGGGAKSGKWSQLKSDMFDIRVEKVKNIEISSVGAAIMSAVALGSYADYQTAMKHMISIDTVFEPNYENTKRYHERYLEFLSQQTTNNNK